MMKAFTVLAVFLATVEGRYIAALGGESGLNAKSLILDQATRDVEFFQMLPQQARELLLPRLEKHMAGLNPRIHDAVVNTHQKQNSERRRKPKNRQQPPSPASQQQEQQQQDDRLALHSTEVEGVLADMKSFSEQTQGVVQSDQTYQPPSYLTLAIRRPGADSCNCETIKRAINTSPEKCIDFCVWKVMRREERRRIDAVMRAEGKGGWVDGLSEGLRGELDKDSS